MRGLLAILLLISASVYGQTDDSTKYINYRNQYGMRMPRGWFDSVLHIPYGDTANFRSTKNGAIMMHLDGTVVQWFLNKWNPFSTGQNFANADLTFSGDRTHNFDGNSLNLTTNDGGDNITAYTQSPFIFRMTSSGADNQNKQWQIGNNAGFTLFNKSITTSKESSIALDTAYLYFKGDTVKLTGRLQALAGMPDGSAIDSIIVWSSTDKFFKKVAQPKAIPIDDYYETESGDCHDTSFVNASGYLIESYEEYNLPQFIGLRMRVNAGGIQLPSDDRAAWFFTWNNTTGVLRIYAPGTCVDNDIPGQQRLFQAY